MLSLKSLCLKNSKIGKMSDFNIVIVEDDPIYGKIIKHKLSMDSDYNVKLYENARSMLSEVGNFFPHVVTLDLNLPDMNGLELLKEIKEISPETQVIILSGQDKIDTAIELFKLGIFDYIMKDPHAFDKLWFSVHKATKHIELSEEITLLRKEVSKKYNFKEQIIGASQGIQTVFSLIEKTSTNNINVIVTGETGTGKELVAKAIHFNSNRKNKPFVAVNVAAIPKDLVESEMFGFEKGAFTGANQSKPGKLEEAKGGTLFLDEIGEMDMAMQAKLLRVLQEMEVTRLGSNRLIPLDFRLIVATHRNLLSEVTKGNFREDLYYRLLGVTIDIPSLRNRKGDIIVIANYFIKKFAKANRMPVKELSAEAKSYLNKHPFPGNVRELKAIVETGFIMSENNQIELSDLKTSQNISLKTEDLIDNGMCLEDYTNQIIKLHLIKNNHNVINTAKELKIGKSTIYRLIQEGKLTLS
jgi:two-component system, NtrC family, response regulator AtoC